MDYLGIDYGTTTSLLTKYSDGTVVHAAPPMPSCVAVKDKDFEEIVCGTTALNEHLGDGGFVRSPKRSLNTESEYRGFKKNYGVDCSDAVHAVLTSLFRQVKSDSATLTLTVPNAFMDWQCREMTRIVRDACISAGLPLHSLYLLPEPVAATVCFIYKNFGPFDCPLVEPRGHVLVSDIGGGTTDLAIVEYEYDSSNGRLSVAVRCTAQCGHLGGDDFTDIVINMLRARGCDAEGRKLWRIADGIKRNLTWNDRVGHDDISISRDDFNSSMAPFVTKYEELLDGMLGKFRREHNGAMPNSLRVIRVGGSSRIPLFDDILKRKLPGVQFFNMGENSAGESVFDSVAIGAALYSAYKGTALDMFRSIRIENRTEHPYLMCLSDNRTELCVPANATDGVYSPDDPIHPVTISSDGVFTIGRLVILQGDEDHDEHPVVADLKLDDEICAHGRLAREIDIEFKYEIRNLRLASVTVAVPEGTDIMQNEKYQRYEKVFDL